MSLLFSYQLLPKAKCSTARRQCTAMVRQPLKRGREKKYPLTLTVDANVTPRDLYSWVDDFEGQKLLRYPPKEACKRIVKFSKCVCYAGGANESIWHQVIRYHLRLLLKQNESNSLDPGLVSHARLQNSSALPETPPSAEVVETFADMANRLCVLANAPYVCIASAAENAATCTHDVECGCHLIILVSLPMLHGPQHTGTDTTPVSSLLVKLPRHEVYVGLPWRILPKTLQEEWRHKLERKALEQCTVTPADDHLKLSVLPCACGQPNRTHLATCGWEMRPFIFSNIMGRGAYVYTYQTKTGCLEAGGLYG